MPARSDGPDTGTATSPGRHRLALVTAAATLVLIFVGGLVTSTGSGLSVPDWPLSFGSLMPPMVGGVVYEHTHRLVAAAVGLMTLILAVWTARSEARAGVRGLAWAALALVVAQGVLGGITVLHGLPIWVSVAHACLAQTFLCFLIAFAYATSRGWARAGPPREDTGGIRGAALLATGLVFGQLLVGAVMRHTGAGLAISDFPLARGRIVPPLDDPRVAIHFAHRAAAVLILAAAIRLCWLSRRSTDPGCRRASALALVLVLGQITLGAATVLTARAVVPTTLHVAMGAAALGACWLATLRTFRHLRPMERARAAAVASP